MAKRPFRAWMRDKLLAHAKEVVQPAAEKKAMDAAYKAAVPLVVAIVEKKYPHMRLLEKYGVCTSEDEAKIQSPSGLVVQMKFRNSDHISVPSGRCYRQIYLGDERAVAAIEKYNAAIAAYQAEYKKRVDAFTTLLHGAGYVEDVTDVWPEAASVIPSSAMTAQIAPEQIAIIKADMRERKAA